MTRIMGVTEARSRLGELVDQVRYQGDAVVLEKNGRPAAALVPIALFEQLLKHREAAYHVVTDVQAQNEALAIDEDELLTLINAAVHAVRDQAKPSTSQMIARLRLT